VIATGAAALKEGDRYVLATEDGASKAPEATATPEAGPQPAGATGGRRGRRGGIPQADPPRQQGL